MQKILLSRPQVMWLPAILFFDSRDNEIPGSRVTGFINAADFSQHLRKLAP
ncbi:hypothetical protein [Sodalis-like endosymbiont of Proechinophthirus fluctus]|uniref:hypothetical protein n=1 Tax=Sodalis-like endosymbiont of Proechinophthirus fluctus TaxID=1462730 RepID=UPI00195F0C02